MSLVKVWACGCRPRGPARAPGTSVSPTVATWGSVKTTAGMAARSGSASPPGHVDRARVPAAAATYTNCGMSVQSMSLSPARRGPS